MTTPRAIRWTQIVGSAVMGIFMVILTIHVASLTKERNALHVWQAKVIRAASDAEGGTTLSQDVVADEIKRLADDRANLRIAIRTQNAANRSLAKQTEQAKAQSAVDLVRVHTITVQRDRWIATAQAKSTNTNWGTCEQELKGVEDALDALYRDGF